MDPGLLARLRDPRIRPIAFGEPKTIAADGGIAEVAGPGVIQQIVLNVPAHLPERFSLRNIRLKIYLDRRAEPALDLPIPDLFSGLHPHFPRPLVGHAAGGYYSYVPIAFRDGCRMKLDGPHAGRLRARLSGIALPEATDVTSFQEDLSSADQVQLDQAAAVWSKPGDRIASLGAPTESSDFVVDGAARSTQRYLLPAGPRTIRSLEIEPAPGTSDAWRDARLKLFWERDDRAAGVNLPLGFAFARVLGVEPGSSLLVGSSGPVWFNRFPMPYRRQAFLQIDSEAAIRGTIRVRSVRVAAADAGYFCASYREGALGNARALPRNRPGHSRLSNSPGGGTTPGLSLRSGAKRLALIGLRTPRNAPTMFASSSRDWALCWRSTDSPPNPPPGTPRRLMGCFWVIGTLRPVSPWATDGMCRIPSRSIGRSRQPSHRATVRTPRPIFI